MDEWEWAKWLPHTADASGAHGRRLTCDAQASNAVLRDLLAAGKGATTPTPPGPVTLVVLDAESLTAGPNAPARAVLRGEGGAVAGLVVSEARHRSPQCAPPLSSCAAVTATLSSASPSRARPWSTVWLPG
ncbi:MAG: hypothetical protein ACRDSM_13460 [Pseudonocardiaceae bacterium]